MIELDNVQVKIGGFQILRNVTLRLGEGETVLLIGRNGAGKTTTLRTIMGLLPLDSGRLLMDGEDLTRIPSHGRAGLGLGYAPEDRRLIGDFTVEDNLLLPALALKLSSAERSRRLDEVHDLLPELNELRGRSAGSLSGGQGKMVALGRALMAGTRCMLLDEPFQGLAPSLAHNYAGKLERLRREKQGLTMLVTESTPQLLENLVDRTLRIERGEVAPHGNEG